MGKKKHDPTGEVLWWVDAEGRLHVEEVPYPSTVDEAAFREVYEKVKGVAQIVTVYPRKRSAWPTVIGAVSGQSFLWQVTDAGALSFSWNGEERMVMAPGTWFKVFTNSSAELLTGGGARTTPSST